MKFHPTLIGKNVASGPDKLQSSNDGFTIIEVMIVLVLAGTILILVFFAIPSLQRNARNHQRDRDAQLLATAIGECLANHSFKPTACDEPDEIPLTPDELMINTGFHYGKRFNPTPPQTSEWGPDIDEPNWLFNLVCNEKHTWFSPPVDGTSFVVTYLREDPNGPYQTKSRCIDG